MTAAWFTDAGDEILLDGTDGAGTDAGDKVLNCLFTSEGDDLLYEGEIYYKLFTIVTRPHEKNKLSGASWVFIASAVTTVLFNEKIAIISLLTMSLSDSAAAIIGIRYGSTKLYNKSLYIKLVSA